MESSQSDKVFRIKRKSDLSSSKRLLIRNQTYQDNSFNKKMHTSLDKSKLQAFRQTLKRGDKNISLSNLKSSPILETKKILAQKARTSYSKKRNNSTFQNNVEFNNVKWISIVSAYDPKKLQYVSATKQSLESFFKNHQDFNDPQGKSQFKIVLTNFKSWVMRINRQYFIVLDKFLYPKNMTNSILLSIFSVKPLLAQLKVNTRMMQQKVQACLDIYSNKDFRILLQRFRTFLDASDQIQRIIEIVNKSKHRIDDLFQDIQRERDLDKQINKVRQKGINRIKKVIQRYSDNNLQEHIVNKVTQAINQMADKNIDAYNHLKGAKNIMKRIHSTVLDTQSSVTTLSIQNISTMVKIFTQVLAQAQQYDIFAANFLKSGDLINDDLRTCIKKYQQQMQLQRQIVQQLQNKFINTILQEVINLLKKSVSIVFAIDQSAQEQQYARQVDHTQNFQNINKLLQRICDNMSDQKAKAILDKLVKESRAGYMKLEQDVAKIKNILQEQKIARKRTNQGQCFYIDNQKNMAILEQLNKHMKQYKQRLKNLILKQEEAYHKFNNKRLKPFKIEADAQIEFIQKLQILSKKINSKDTQLALSDSTLFKEIQEQQTFQDVIDKLPKAKDGRPGQPLIRKLEKVKVQLYELNKNNQLSELLGAKIQIQNPLFYESQNMASIYYRAQNVKKQSLINDISRIISQSKSMKGLSPYCSHFAKKSLSNYVQKVVILGLINGLQKQDVKIIQNPKSIQFPEKDYEVEQLTRRKKYFQLLIKIITPQSSFQFVHEKMLNFQIRAIQILDNYALLKEYQQNVNNNYFFTTNNLDKFVQSMFSQIFTPTQSYQSILEYLKTNLNNAIQLIEIKLAFLENTTKRIKVNPVKNYKQKLVKLNQSFLEKLQQLLIFAKNSLHIQENHLLEVLLTIYAEFVLGTVVYLQQSEQDCYVVLNSTQQPIWVGQIKCVNKGIGPEIGIMNMERGKFVNNFKNQAAIVSVKQIKKQEDSKQNKQQTIQQNKQRQKDTKKEKKAELKKKKNSQQIEDIQMQNQDQDINKETNNNIDDDLDDSINNMKEQMQQNEQIKDTAGDIDQEMEDDIANDDIDEEGAIQDVDENQIKDDDEDQLYDQTQKPKPKVEKIKKQQQTKQYKNIKPAVIQQIRIQEPKKIKANKFQSQNSPSKFPKLTKDTQLPETHSIIFQHMPKLTTLINLHNFFSFLYNLRFSFLNELNYFKIGQYFNRSSEEEIQNYVKNLLTDLDEFICRDHKDTLRDIKSTKIYSKLAETLVSIQNNNWEIFLNTLKEKNYNYTIIGFNDQKAKSQEQQFQIIWILPLKNDPLSCLRKYLYTLLQQGYQEELETQQFLKQCCLIEEQKFGKNMTVSVLKLKNIRKQQDLWNQKQLSTHLLQLKQICQLSQKLQDGINLFDLSANIWHKIMLQDEQQSSSFQIPIKYDKINSWVVKLTQVSQKQLDMIPHFIYFLHQRRKQYKNQIKNLKKHKSSLQQIILKSNSSNILQYIKDLQNIYRERLKDKHHFYLKKEDGKYSELLLDICAAGSNNIPKNQFTKIWQSISKNYDKQKSLTISEDKLIETINQISAIENMGKFKKIFEIMKIQNYLFKFEDSVGQIVVFGYTVKQVIQRVFKLRKIKTSEDFNIEEFSRDVLKIIPIKGKTTSSYIQLKQKLNSIEISQEIFSNIYYQTVQLQLKQQKQKISKMNSILLTENSKIALKICLVFWKIELDPEIDDTMTQSFTNYYSVIPSLIENFDQFSKIIKLQTYEKAKNQTVKDSIKYLKEQDSIMKKAGNVIDYDIFERIEASKKIYNTVYQYQNKGKKLNCKNYCVSLTGPDGNPKTYLFYYSFDKTESMEQFLKLFVLDFNSRGEKINKSNICKYIVELCKNHQSRIQKQDGNEHIVINGDEIIDQVSNILGGQASETQIIYSLLKSFYKFNFDQQQKDLDETLDHQNKLIRIWSEQCSIFQVIAGLAPNQYTENLKTLINFNEQKQQALSEKSKILADLQKIKITNKDSNSQRFTELMTQYMDSAKILYYNVLEYTQQQCVCLLPGCEVQQIKQQLKNLGFSQQFKMMKDSNGILFIKLNPVHCKLIVQSSLNAIQSVSKEDTVKQYFSKDIWQYELEIYRDDALKPFLVIEIFQQKQIAIQITSLKNKNNLKIMLKRKIKEKEEKICQDRIKAAKGHNSYKLSTISKEIDSIYEKIKVKQANRQTMEDAINQLNLLKNDINDSQIHMRPLDDVDGPKLKKVQDLEGSEVNIQQQNKKLQKYNLQAVKKVQQIIKKRKDSLTGSSTTIFDKVANKYLQWIYSQLLIKQQIENRIVQYAKQNYEKRVQEYYKQKKKVEKLRKQRQEYQNQQGEEEIQDAKIIIPKAPSHLNAIAQIIGEKFLQSIQWKESQYSEAFTALLLQQLLKLSEDETFIMML